MPKLKRSKFNVDKSKAGTKKRTINGVTFDSLVEFKYYSEVLLEGQKRGEIVDIVLQPVFVLQPAFEKNGKKYLPIKYIADFKVIYKDGTEKIVDIKGMETPQFQLKAKMFEYVFPEKTLTILSYSKIDGGFVDPAIIKTGRAKRKKARQLNENHS